MLNRIADLPRRVAVVCGMLMVFTDAWATDSHPIDPAVLAAQTQRVATMQKAADATVAIFGLDGGGGGSGVLISPDGYTLTNYHVSSACGDHMRCGLNDGKMYDAVIVGVDATGDVSLIKLLGRDDFPTAPLADSDQVKVGQWCFAAGNPFVLATNLQPTISMGIVSGVNRYQYPAGTLLEYADCIQTDAAINPGNSGGPLFNMAGSVIGVNGRCSFEKRGRVNVGVGYAISANQLKYFLGVLRSGRLVDHATLGATVSTEESGKILVSNILSSSDGYRRGLRYGDEVVSLADREVKTTNMFKNVLGTLPRDWRVPIAVRRNGETKTLLVRLEGVHTPQELVDLVEGEIAPGQTPHGDQNPQDDEESEKEEPEQGPESAPAKPNDASLRYAELRPNTELVNSMLEKRVGFANYYFNRLNRDRVWNAVRDHGDFAVTAATWTMTGKLAGEQTKVELTVSPEVGQISVGSRNSTVKLDDAMSDVVSSRGQGGMLVALRALQELLQVGPEKLGDTVYLGTAPVYTTTSTTLNSQPLHDVLEALWHDAKVRIMVDPASGTISLIEVFGDAGNDPIEVYVDQYLDFESGENTVSFPSRLRLQYGTEPMMLVTIESISLHDDTAEQTEDEAR